MIWLWSDKNTAILQSSPTCSVFNAHNAYIVDFFRNFERMGRTLAIDYGTKRTGLAWTDPLGMFATKLDPVPTTELPATLQRIVSEGPVETIVLGWPTNFDDSPTDATPHVERFHRTLLNKYPELQVVLFDEQMTTQRARQVMWQGGASKKQRRDNHLINSVSAVILLQDYLEENA